jgi:methylphosphotriester-DNA--protein-cysteine methyltransferase
MAAETFLCFGPDTLAEARNRGYRRCQRCPGARAAAESEAASASVDAG